MPETITLFVDSIEDVSPVSKDSIEITLAGVDLAQLISEVGYEALLSEIKEEYIKEFLEEKQKENDEDE